MLCSQWLVTGVTCNDVRGAAGQHALNGSQIKRRVNELSMMLKLRRITRFDTNCYCSPSTAFVVWQRRTSPNY